MASRARRAAAASRTKANEWGGEDYRGGVGMARTAVEDGATTVFLFTAHGRADLLTWQATFSSATPAAVVAAAVESARRQADGRA